MAAPMRLAFPTPNAGAIMPSFPKVYLTAFRQSSGVNRASVSDVWNRIQIRLNTNKSLTVNSCEALVLRWGVIMQHAIAI